MRNTLFIAGLLFASLGCRQSNTTGNAPSDPTVHMGIALEKINTTKYTYMLVNEKGVENWIAFPLSEVTTGETYYYTNEMLMTNFESKELGRVFEKVYFVPGVSLEEPTAAMAGQTANVNPQPLQPGVQPAMQAEVQQQVAPAASVSDPGGKKGVALEKINTTKYTYLRVNENGTEKWLAFPLTEVKVGQTYYYGDEMLMTNFESKELKRTFKEVYFVQGVSAKPMGNESVTPLVPESGPQTGSAAVAIEKQNVKIEPVKGGISVSDLFAGKEKYAGKKVLIRGKVTKYNAQIMGRNWIHIQDGSSYKGSYDLTLSSQRAVQVGETYTFEGTVILNKDFGAGYTYDVLLEDVEVK